MEPRVIDEGVDGPFKQHRWRIVEWAPSEYALQEIFTPDDPRAPRSWKQTPLDRREVWERYPAEVGMLSYRPYPRKPAPWWYRLFWGVDSR